MTAQLVTDALVMAIWRRGKPDALLHHSDRGSQYAGSAYQTVLRQHAAVCSMSRSGDCWDNAVVESFFAALKVERLHERRFTTKEELEAEVRDYIETFYNRRRRHSTLGYLSPVDYERAALPVKLAA